MDKEETLDIQIFYSPPGDICSEGCWNAYVYHSSGTYQYNGDTVREILQCIADNLDLDIENGTGLVG